ncbi:MAG TPA: glycosyltransferase family 4 protein [Burkholderiales bacterium]|nr:glycosyltransferase family 4 protein [Burkholderiales bacterium]
MKILYLHPQSWSGEYVMLKRLAAMGHSVCVLEEIRRPPFAARRTSPDFMQAGDGMATLWYDPHKGAEKLITWPVDRFFKRAFEGRNLAHRMWLVRAAVKAFRPDAIVSSEGFAYGIPASFLKRLGLLTPLLMVSYIGGDILDCPEAQVGKRRTPLVSWLIRSALPGQDVTRATGPFIARHLLDEGADPKKIAIVPSHMAADRPVVDDIHARRAEVRRQVRAKLGVSEHTPLVVTLSRNMIGKGLHVLAAAWPAISANIPGIRWLLCGPHNDWLDKGVFPPLRAAGLQDTVLQTGALEGAAVFEHLAAADLHLNPSLCEGLNMVTVEAAGVGTPTITTDGTGIAAWITDSACGKVVPAGNAAALADATVHALQDPATLSLWGQRSRAMSLDFESGRVAGLLVAALASMHG